MTEPQIDREIFDQGWAQLKTDVDGFLAQPGMLDSMGLTGKDMVPFYEAAYNAFVAEDYVQAENLFLILFLADMKEHAFQSGLAAAFEAQEKFMAALAIYGLAVAGGADEDPRLMFRMAKCLLGLENVPEARLWLEKAALCRPKTNKEIKAVEQAKKMLALLSN